MQVTVHEPRAEGQAAVAAVGSSQDSVRPNAHDRVGTEKRQGASVVHGRLREMILSGELSPGTVMSQVEMSTRLGVSRTPLREALRMLQEEGLVEAELNRRAKVAEFSPADLDAVYAKRVVLESLGVALTVPRATELELNEATLMLKEMRRLADADDLTGWHEVHRGFHAQLVRHAHEQLRRSIQVYADRGQRYVRLYQRTRPRAWSAEGETEHQQILDAFLDRQVDLATSSTARHLARTALSTMAHYSPESEPVATRAAVRMATGSRLT